MVIFSMREVKLKFEEGGKGLGKIFCDKWEGKKWSYYWVGFRVSLRLDSEIIKE